MGAMDWDASFNSPGDFYGAPSYPDVHREWVRRESVSGSQGLVNQHSSSGRMGLPRLYDYGGLNQCMLLPDVPHAVCQDTNIEKKPAPEPEEEPEPDDDTLTRAFGLTMGALIGLTALMALV